MYQGKVEQSRQGVAPSPTPRCRSYWKGSLLVTLNYSRQLYYICTVLYISECSWIHTYTCTHITVNTHTHILMNAYKYIHRHTSVNTHTHSHIQKIIKGYSRLKRTRQFHHYFKKWCLAWTKTPQNYKSVANSIEKCFIHSEHFQCLALIKNLIIEFSFSSICYLQLL